jgi:phosphoribosylglycinamide formyltransferase-1
VKRVAIFASGSGTNAENIINYFSANKNIDVSLILSNKRDAYVLERAGKYGVSTFVFGRREFYQSDEVINILRKYQINFVVLAGFLWLVPENILKEYNKRIINIHPALLPKYGGKGMYGERVHKTVLENNEKESGISIHYVNEIYDAGDIIFQKKCMVDPKDTPESLAERIHKLEYEYYPKVIEELLNGI